MNDEELEPFVMAVVDGLIMFISAVCAVAAVLCGMDDSVFLAIVYGSFAAVAFYFYMQPWEAESDPN